MANEVTLNASKARAGVARITELIENVAAATITYKAILENEVDRSNIVWMKSLAGEAQKISEAIHRAQQALADVQASLSRYTAEVDEYSTDTTGL